MLDLWRSLETSPWGWAGEGVFLPLMRMEKSSWLQELDVGLPVGAEDSISTTYVILGCKDGLRGLRWKSSGELGSDGDGAGLSLRLIIAGGGAGSDRRGVTGGCGRFLREGARGEERE